MQLKFVVLVSVAIGMMTPSGALGHHSAVEYDRTKSVTVQATVVEFHYSAPHPQLLADAKDQNGKLVHWEIEIGPNPTGLARIGWGRQRAEAALTPGAVITLTIAPSKLNPAHGLAQKIVTAGGQQVFGVAVHQTN